ncbi:Rossmann fold nucleotide-binding protein Smf possibly involved in DNA uptake [hydrothermal vent metagenome]|uniref:Rossmann fold nucleotide-binding protein Smf possibly involved in DNA uptake n=1 Tax=hydrothermal vent metagenome TaxID=652676 RepID=A0A3B0RCX3_9ZZZZ
MKPLPNDDDRDIFHRLRLIRSANVGPVTYVQLIKRFGSAESALEALPDLAARGGGKRAPRIADQKAVEREIAATEKLGASFLFLGEPGYPYLLSQLNSAPPALIWQGNLPLFEKPIVAIVGARNASAAACRFACDLANGLSNAGVSIVSGLARGIDTAAHQGSVGKGTIGVIAGGVDVYFPPENEELQKRVSREGLIVSEQPTGTEPRARHFPSRNRIIAGLARGTVIVEAAPRSGSLITARLAGEAGRQVMAVPGSPLDPRAQGCNNLIREGATLVQSAEDVLELIRHFDDRAEMTGRNYIMFEKTASDSNVRENISQEIKNIERHQLTELLSLTPVSIDELVRQSDLSPANVQLGLLELELAGRLTRHAGARVCLTS